MKTDIWSFVTSLGLLLEGRYLQTRFSKILNWSVDKNTRPSICFQTRGRAFETTQLSLWNTRPSFWRFKKNLKARASVWKAWPRVCVITRSRLSKLTPVYFLRRRRKRRKLIQNYMDREMQYHPGYVNRF